MRAVPYPEAPPIAKKTGGWGFVVFEGIRLMALQIIYQ
jgi:hypothetical protein